MRIWKLSYAIRLGIRRRSGSCGSNSAIRGGSVRSTLSNLPSGEELRVSGGHKRKGVILGCDEADADRGT